MTRNSFNGYGWDSIIERLRIPQDVMNATSEARAREKLVQVLEEGRLPIVWADVYSLGPERSDMGSEIRFMQPVVVTSYDPDGEATILDRSRSPITVPAATLDSARGRVKKERYRMVAIETPEVDDLAAAVRSGIAECASLFTEKPPRGSPRSFGFGAYDTLIEHLTTPGSRGSWAKLLPGGRELAAGLVSAFTYSQLFWKDESRTADRSLFADSLDEAAPLLSDDDAASPAELARSAGETWRRLGDALLPDTVPLLAEARENLVRRHALPRSHPDSSELGELDSRLESILAEAVDELPGAGDAEWLSNAAEIVATIRDQERELVGRLERLAP